MIILGLLIFIFDCKNLMYYRYLFEIYIWLFVIFFLGVIYKNIDLVIIMVVYFFKSGGGIIKCKWYYFKNFLFCCELLYRN